MASSQLTRSPAPLRALPARPYAEWIAVGAAGLILGLVAARAASSRSTGSVLVLFVALIPFVLMIVRDVRKLLLLAIVFDTAFQWDKNFDLQTLADQYGPVSGLNISLTTLALAALYLMWFAELSAKRTSVPHGTLRAVFPPLLYVSLTALSTFAAGDKLLSGFEVALLVQMLLLFVYLVGTVRTRNDVMFLLAALSACIICESLVAIVVEHFGSGHTFFGIKTSAYGATAGETGRSGGTLGSPNGAGAFFSLLVPSAIVLTVVAGPGRIRKLAATAGVLGTIALVLTFSRGGWIAFGVALLVLTVVAIRRGWIRSRAPIAGMVVVLLLLIPFGGVVIRRITGPDQGTAAARLPLIHIAETIIRKHPFTGTGANNLGITMPQYAGPQYGRAWIYTVHNKYLLVWGEAGIATLIAFLLYLLAILRRGLRVWRVDDPLLSPLALGLTAGVIGQMAHMAVDQFQSRQMIQPLWLIAGIIVAMSQIVAGSPAPDAGRAPAGPRRALEAERPFRPRRIGGRPEHQGVRARHA